MSVKDTQNYSNDVLSPGYIESTASTTKKSKEKIRVDSLIPSEILENSDGIKQLLEAYYTFMNLEEFIYAENESFEDVILDGKAVFRISDPRNENDEFFTDEQGADSILRVIAADGSVTLIPLNDINVNISNGNELPGSLALETSEIGKTFQVNGLEAYNTYTAELTTPVKHWVGPGPSHVLNNIERAMDIDNNSQSFLELMQKEIASVIPRNITVNKRNLYKNIVDYYKVRGSSDAIEIFFRLLFNDEVEVQYPWDKTLIPSSGNWDVNPALPKGGQYLDNKGQLSNVIRLQDSLRYQKFSYLIRTGQNVSTWENVFNRLVHPAGFKFFGEILIIMELTKAILGEDTIEGDTLYRKVLSAMPERQPGAIGIEDLPILVDMFASVFLPSIQGRIHKTGTVNIPSGSIKNGVISTVAVTSGGSGYTSPPVLNSSDAGTPSGFTTGTFNAVITNGSVSSVNVVHGGYDYDSPLMTAAAPSALIFDGSDDEDAFGAGIVNLVDNTIKLSATEAAAIPIGARVTYSSGTGTSIGGLVSGNQYYIMTNSGTEVTLQEVINGPQIQISSVGSTSSINAGSFVVGDSYIITSSGSTDFIAIGAEDNDVGTTFTATGVGSGSGTANTAHTFTGQTATLSPSKIDGTITKIVIDQPGYGYTVSPTVTMNGVAISGQNIVQPTINIGLDANGRLDNDNITIVNGGSGYLTAFGSVTANPNSGQLAAVEIAGGADKNYNTTPSIIISEPTAKDAAGILLPTNAQASAVFTLAANGEINGYNITNPGSGYIDDPILRIDSNANNEIRGKDIRPILILLLNHIEHGVRTIVENNRFNRKGNTFNDGAKRWNFNSTFDQLGSRQIQSTTTTNINKYNVNSFIQRSVI